MKQAKPLTPAAEGIKRLLANGRQRAEIKRRQAEARRRENDWRTPTPERLAKGDIVSVSARTQATLATPDIHHQVKDPFDPVKKYMSEEAIAAIARYVVNAEYAHRHRAITANYEGASGGAFGPRHGGLPDAYREAASIYGFVVGSLWHEWRAFAEHAAGLRAVLDGKPMTGRDIVGLMLPDMGDPRRRDGAYIAFWKAFGFELLRIEAQLHASLRGESRPTQRLERAIRMERNGRRK